MILCLVLLNIKSDVQWFNNWMLNGHSVMKG